MLGRLFHDGLRAVTMRTGRWYGLYKAMYHPSAYDYGEWLRRHGGLHSMGAHVGVTIGTSILDPALVRIGNNVLLARCSLIGHDGSIAVLNRAYGVRIDKVGPIDIRDNVFVGHDAVIMPGVRIGPNAIVAAGAVVTRDVPEGSIVAGVPAKVVGRVEDRIRKLSEETSALPWGELIAQREGAFDPTMEPELVRRRVEHFFGSPPRER